MPNKHLSKPGVAKQHVLQNYADLPNNIEDFLNGHVLAIQYSNPGSKRTLIVNKLVSLLTVSDQDVSTWKNTLHASVKKVLDHTDKFKKLRNEHEFQSFVFMCVQKFEWSRSRAPRAPVPSTSEPSTKQPSPVPLTVSPVETRQVTKSKCDSCKIYRATIKELVERNRHLRKSIIAEKKKTKAVRVLNQKLKRRENSISVLKQRLKDKSVVSFKKALASAERKNQKLKAYYKRRKTELIERYSMKHAKATAELKDKLDASSSQIAILENEKLLVEDKLEAIQNAEKETRDGKTYSPEMRMMVYDALVSNVPTNNIPKLIQKFSLRCELNLLDVPHRTTTENMARELGVIAEFQAAEVIVGNMNCTLGFDATTQEGVHVNSIHVTTESSCYYVAVEEVPGGTAKDYHDHICESFNRLASVYAHFQQCDYQETRKKLIGNIANTMTDRCAVNHATVELLKSSWGKMLNELNCHLHPLDTIASETRATLKKFEKERKIAGTLVGSDCIAANIILQMNKMRYKDGKGDPRGFTSFLDSKHLKRGILPRYRGNRLHVLFHIAGVLVCHYQLFSKYLETGTGCRDLRQCLRADFGTVVAHVELQVLGLIGKLLTGPWMKMFYTAVPDQINHIQGIALVKEVIGKLKEASSIDLLTCAEDFFGTQLDEEDLTLIALREDPKDIELFKGMMRACLEAIINVLERQYSRYFTSELTETLKTETQSSRSHNIDAEEIMGMFSALKKKAPSATLCFLSSKMRAQKNKSVEYLDGLEQERRNVILKKVIPLGQMQRAMRRQKQKDLRAELIRREEEKQQAQHMADRRKVARTLRNAEIRLEELFPEIAVEILEKVKALLTGRAVGQEIVHVWHKQGKQFVYNGKLEKLKKQEKKYVVAYWDKNETYDDAVDFDISAFELAADVITANLVL